MLCARHGSWPLMGMLSFNPPNNPLISKRTEAQMMQPLAQGSGASIPLPWGQGTQATAPALARSVPAWDGVAGQARCGDVAWSRWPRSRCGRTAWVLLVAYMAVILVRAENSGRGNSCHKWGAGVPSMFPLRLNQTGPGVWGEGAGSCSGSSGGKN